MASLLTSSPDCDNCRRLMLQVSKLEDKIFKLYKIKDDELMSMFHIGPETAASIARPASDASEVSIGRPSTPTSPAAEYDDTVPARMDNSNSRALFHVPVGETGVSSAMGQLVPPLLSRKP